MFFKNYEYFLAIAEYKNITKAAEKLYISQPALSKYLSRLEENVGVSLFDKSKSPLKLTYAGERYVEYVKQVINWEKQLKREFEEIQSDLMGTIHLGVGLWRSSYMLPAILPAFLEKYPHIKVQIHEGGDEQLLQLLETDRVDFCVMNLNKYVKNVDINILMRERILLAANERNPLLNQLGYTFTDNSKDILYFDILNAKDETLIIPHSGQTLYSIVSEFLNKAGFIPKKTFDTANIATAINLVSAGLGITFIPEAVIRHQIKIDHVVYFTVDTPELAWNLTIVWKKNNFVPRITKLLIDEIKRYYGN